MTVVDTSCVVDLLLGEPPADALAALLSESEDEPAAPDVLVFETLAVIRRLALRGEIVEHRAAGAVADLGDVRIALFPAMPLRDRAWDLRGAMTTADALFVALAEQLEEPLLTKDAALARAAAKHSEIEVRVPGPDAPA
jgi:predicted nucleic acid-binding protein